MTSPFITRMFVNPFIRNLSSVPMIPQWPNFYLLLSWGFPYLLLFFMEMIELLEALVAMRAFAFTCLGVVNGIIVIVLVHEIILREALIEAEELMNVNDISISVTIALPLDINDGHLSWDSGRPATCPFIIRVIMDPFLSNFCRVCMVPERSNFNIFRVHLDMLSKQ